MPASRRLQDEWTRLAAYSSGRGTRGKQAQARSFERYTRMMKLGIVIIETRQADKVASGSETAE